MDMEQYRPPFDITDEMLGKISEIMEDLGELRAVRDLDKLPRLRKVNRIKSIHSTLAIEDNSLSMGQVTDILGGVRVQGDKDDILAVKNAVKAYDLIGKVDVFDLRDLLRVHGVMLDGLVSEAGQIRSGQVGVYNESGEVIHLAPPAQLVRGQLVQLLDWVKNSNVNMLIKSSVFHYEFEFLHPFRDGNGRMGRLWHTALLSSWRDIFEWIPVESIIKDNQEEYYRAIAYSTSQAKSNIFVEFMLDVISDAVKQLKKDAFNHTKSINRQVQKLLEVMDYYPQTAEELMKKLNLKSRNGFRVNYINPALELGCIKRTEQKAKSKKQKYYKV